jgi:hypothetical protein
MINALLLLYGRQECFFCVIIQRINTKRFDKLFMHVKLSSKGINKE